MSVACVWELPVVCLLQRWLAAPCDGVYPAVRARGAAKLCVFCDF